MSLNVSGILTLPPTNPPNVDTPACCCENPECGGTTACYREFAASETGWREIAARPARWVLANGQAI